MLKLTYTENSFCLECLTQSLEDWVTTRLKLALRSGSSLFVEPSTAAFLLPADLPYLVDLETLRHSDREDLLEIVPCDAESVEVVLQGTWLASSPESEEGIFVCAMRKRAEWFLYQLWQEVEAEAFVP
jgi:hypothetical protein